MKDNMRKDNKGMTLVEIMAAITILAVITFPFLNSFLASARNNQKARELLRATTVAQNLMESMEAFPLEEICTRMNQEAAISGIYLPHGYEAHYELGNETGEISGRIVDGKYEFQETNSNTYCFAIQGLEEDGQLYDARIFLDASGYRGNESLLTYNENYRLDINVMNENTDVIFSVSRAEEEVIFEEAGWHKNEDWDKVKRIFRVEVKQDERNDTSEKISISLEYQHEDTSCPVQVMQGKSLDKTLTELKNVYIMYYPNYASVETKIMDCFQVELNQKENFNLCFIKQKYDTSKPEEYYTAFLDITDTRTLTEENIPRVTLRTNIGKNLYDGEDSDVRSDALQYSYRNGNILSEAEAKRRMGFVNQMPQSLVGQKKKNSPIFKTTIEIFPSGTCDGRNPSKFDTAEPLAKLTNE